MRPSFEYYMASVDRMPFHVGVDLGLRADSPVDGLVYRAHIRLELVHPTVDGLCTREEAALLYEVEDKILALFAPDDIRFCAHVTHQKARTMVIYLREEPVEGTGICQRILDVVDAHTVTIMHEDDPEWTEYTDFLYPDTNFQHQIKDRHVLEEFERQGDDCSQVHAIEPSFSGLEEKAARKLAGKLETIGFSIRDLSEEGLNGQRSWRVLARAESPLALAILDDFRQTWLNLAEECDGCYDGWSAEVIPVGTEPAIDSDDQLG